ncbi:nicotinate-nucleotide--dimethylbenzimidazole phosphoribosyltransferase [Dendronalium sp. ChiSLP03b]|uniref:nicotinate-nucleotide--dimethylbenzimidazole phosphoribosyltransferase n=1 Tax=Dendronalium sp. ChiSLP03b TaxID=3075381 RepID=UPI002AD55586|nr:nicotinate-nucleotide--dimethylbenzimidazole phosphoribosyltransferase [Dendronalium sp. ChiSLP03b]MDZ8204521.1 nicotinate-nucleotide--dimethylbenzimidazole phosphoribosyltransferase [Dendronalium sp. ChiSLP03b]
MINIYTQTEQGKEWIAKYRGCLPLFACVLGFTETGLIPGISAAGRTPEDRKYTACADAEFLYYGPEQKPQHPLPPLTAGASPVLISRAVVEALNIPVYLFDAGLPQAAAVPAIDLGGTPARCLSEGAAMELAIVRHLLEQGLLWGERLAADIQQGYLIIGECVVGGTTTALAILTGLGIDAVGKVNSSHPVCNHTQKWALVEAGLERWRAGEAGGAGKDKLTSSSPSSLSFTASPRHPSGDATLTQSPDATFFNGGNPRTEVAPEGNLPAALSHRVPASVIDPLQLVAAVGDPMQVVVAGMTIAASRSCGVMLAGGTQMLAVYALTSAIAQVYNLSWQPIEVVIGTTRWVAEDPTGGTVDLALNLGAKNPPLLATGVSFANSRYPQLQAYEQGFVKEGMGAGAACIAAHLSHDWSQHQLLAAIETQLERLSRVKK